MKMMKDLENHISESGLKILRKRDITSNVVKALNEDHDRRMKTISENVPRLFVNQFREFAGVKNSVIYNQFQDRKSIYFSYNPSEKYSAEMILITIFAFRKIFQKFGDKFFFIFTGVVAFQKSVESEIQKLVPG